jgi:6-oxo-cyclohex-1-ene-carbonyl-CoA hydrolase
VRESVGRGSVLYEKRPVLGSDGAPVAGIFNVWITLNNPAQFNSYTTDMVKSVILAFREASAARDVVAVVFTGVGDKAFCTGGNTKEYAEYYAGNPQEYRGYMRLFNDMVSAILACDKPVVCRVNGMRIGGGQEIGMACDFTIAQDLARFGQAGPKHGSAPIGGATDFLPVVIGAERAMAACVLCEPFSAHEAYHIGMITDVVPALRVDGKFVANPLVETARMVDEYGRIVFGKTKTGDAAKAGQELLKRGTIDLSLLDAKIEGLCTKLLYTFPECTTKTVEELRKPKLDAWNRNKENARAWLGLNMLAEARAGFRAFNEGTRETGREIDFVALRRALAANTRWSDELTESLMPGAATKRRAARPA